MKILISGASGLVGQRLRQRCLTLGYDVSSLVRTPSANSHEIEWSVTNGIINPAQAEGYDAVVHLAGDNIAGARWTEAKKEAIRASRVVGTTALVRSLLGLAHPPGVFICASATGFYGDRGSEPLTEASPPGIGFLSEISREWEQACQPLKDAGLRVINLRIGIVLSRDGGALAKMLLPFKLGLGGILGSGRQFMSWISLEDLVSVIERCLSDRTLSGPINAVSPGPVTNREFTKALGQAVHRPTICRVPAWVLRLVLGEMADALLLSSTRVIPAKLLDDHFEFRHKTIDAALRHL